MELLSYLLKVSACTAVFFAFYLLVLRRLTFFSFNRYYLLATLLLSFIIPSMEVKIQRVDEPVFFSERPISFAESKVVKLSASAKNVVKTSQILKEAFNWQRVLIGAYILVAVAFLVVTAYKLAQLLKYTRFTKKHVNGLLLVEKDTGFTNCSFFNYVFVDYNSLTPSDLAILVRHEEVHAKRLHSMDKLILMLLKAVLWFNPVVYLYDKALEEVHEYEADEATSKNFGVQHYASLLLKLAVSNNTLSLTHNFVKSPIKQRIKMLFHSKSATLTKLSYLFVLPIGIMLVWVLTVDVSYALPAGLKSIASKIPAEVVGGGNIALQNQDLEKSTDDDKRADEKRQVVSSAEAAVISGFLPSKSEIARLANERSKANVNNKPNANEHKWDLSKYIVSDDQSADRFYSRKAKMLPNGTAYDEVEVKAKSGGSAAVYVPKGAKVLILIDNKPLSEEDAAMLSKDFLSQYKSISATERVYENYRKMYPEYADTYDAVIELPAFQNRTKLAKQKIQFK